MNKSPIEMVGRKFARLTVIKEAGRNKHRRITWLCECECGREVVVLGSHLRNGNTKSCGCYHPDHKREPHGKCRTDEYIVWRGMKERCNNKNNSHYKDYGGRGIQVCDRWINSFSNFLSDMGKRPSSKHTLDRVDVNGNYEPSNCRWSTVEEQSSNKRNSVKIIHDGKEMTVPQIAKLTGISTGRLYRKAKKLQESACYDGHEHEYAPFDDEDDE